MRLILALILPPGYDESYYLFYGRHPALSYFDHPLAVAAWAAAGQHFAPLFNVQPVLALRLPSLLSYTGALLLLSEATRIWFGRRCALLACALGSLAPLLFVCGGLLLLPDSPLLLMLSLLLWWLARHPLHAARSPWESLRFGWILGLLSLCKYQGLLLILTLVVLRLVESIRRRQLRWLDTGLISAGWLMLSWPLWLWNGLHGWRSFAFQAGRTASISGFHWQGPPLFLLSQLALLFPSIGVLLLVALLRPTPNHPAAAGLLRALALPQLVVFLLLAGRMQVLASWLVPAWWLLLPLAAAWLARPMLWQRLWLRGLALFTVMAVPLLTLVAAAHVRWGIARALIPAAVDTSGQLLSPAELRQALMAHPRVWQALREAQVIGSNRYELPGFLALALHGYSRAQYSCYTGDCRGFDDWRASLDPRARRGVLFAVVGDYIPLVTLQLPIREQPWRIQPLIPLGQVPVRRAGQTVALLEFFSFDPSTAERIAFPPKPPR
jgi:4-amino-4-deoxy-L-arabinose transferase-like glycosyltransferase